MVSSCFPRLFSAVADWMSTILHNMASEQIYNAGMKCTAGGSLKIQDAKNSPFAHHHKTLSGYIFTIKACINNHKKNLLTSNISSTCPHSMVNFGPLTAEISWRVLGTPANFNRFRVLASLLLGLIGALQIGSVFAFVCVFLYEVWLAPELVHYIMVALCNRTDHNIFMPFLLLLFFLA